MQVPLSQNDRAIVVSQNVQDLTEGKCYTLELYWLMVLNGLGAKMPVFNSTPDQ